MNPNLDRESRSQQGLGALGEGSGWDMRVCPAAASGNVEMWAPGNLGIWRSGDLEIQKNVDLGIWKSRNLGSNN